MGTSADANGITLQFVNENNEPTEPPIFGRFAQLRGVDRSEALKYTTLAPGEELGSEHWMTLVAVADTKERLDAIVSTATARNGSVNTSCASHRVLIAFHVGDRLQSFENRSVIASGPIVKMDPPEVNVVHVKVLPEHAFVAVPAPENAPLKKGPQQIAREFKGMSPLSATGVKAAAASLVAQETKAAAAAAAAASTPTAAGGANPNAAPGGGSSTK